MSLRIIPYLMICIRIAAGPAALGLAYAYGAGARWACVSLLAIGVVSDILDGVIARRIDSVTDALRTWDSRADLLFWLCVTGALLVMHPRVIGAVWPMVAVLAAMEATTHGISFARFGREASPHHLLSKFFTLSLWALMSQLFVTGDGGWLVAPVFLFGIVSQIEAMAIMSLLPTWRTDVRTWRATLERRSAHASIARRGEDASHPG